MGYMLGGIATAYAADGISVKLSPYILTEVFGIPITATMLTSWLAMFVLIFLALVVSKNLKFVPGKLQSVVEIVVGGGYDYVKNTLGSDVLARRYFPIILTIFLFLLTMNWLGLLPGVTSIGIYEGHGAEAHLIPFFYPPATDINIALSFAIISMVVIEIAGIAALGVWKYGGKFLNFRSPLGFAVGLIELVSEVGRIISFTFRLFGNILAGKILLTVAIFFLPLLLPVPILAYEMFVGLIQAGVFAFLTLIFIKLAITEPH